MAKRIQDVLPSLRHVIEEMDGTTVFVVTLKNELMGETEVWSKPNTSISQLPPEAFNPFIDEMIERDGVTDLLIGLKPGPLDSEELVDQWITNTRKVVNLPVTFLRHIPI